MTTLLVTIHIIVCFVLALSILLQAGKGGSLAGALGGSGGAAGTVLGSRGAATMLGKITTYTAILFLVSCMGLTFVFRGGSGTQIETAAQKEASKRRLMPLTAPEFPPPSEGSGEAGSTSGETAPSSETSGGGETEKTE